MIFLTAGEVRREGLYGIVTGSAPRLVMHYLCSHRVPLVSLVNCSQKSSKPLQLNFAVILSISLTWVEHFLAISAWLHGVPACSLLVHMILTDLSIPGLLQFELDIGLFLSLFILK